MVGLAWPGPAFYDEIFSVRMTAVASARSRGKLRISEAAKKMVPFTAM